MHGAVEDHDLSAADHDTGQLERTFGSVLTRAIACDVDNAAFWNGVAIEGHGLVGLTFEHQERRYLHGRASSLKGSQILVSLAGSPFISAR